MVIGIERWYYDKGSNIETKTFFLKKNKTENKTWNKNFYPNAKPNYYFSEFHCGTDCYNIPNNNNTTQEKLLEK